MPDVEAAIRRSVDHPVAPPRPVAEVADRARRLKRRSRINFLGVAALVLLASAVSVRFDNAASVVTSPGPPAANSPNSAESPSPQPEPGGVDQPRANAPTGPATGTVDDKPRPASGGVEQPAKFLCERGRNGGQTAPGVTDSRVSLFMNATLDGPYNSLSEPARQAFLEVVDRVNEAGGICGRLLSLQVRNGFQVPPDDTLAAFTTPFHPDLDSYVSSGTADRTAAPMIGTDGLTSVHYGSRWLWPVGVPVASLVRIAVVQAYRDGARTFAMVHESATPYGAQAAAALRDYVTTLPGASVRIVVPVDPDASSYAAEAYEFDGACSGNRCDTVVWAMFPGQHDRWLPRGPAKPRLSTEGLFYEMNNAVAQMCSTNLTYDCNTLRLWTGFTPPVAPFTEDPAVAAYSWEEYGALWQVAANGYLAANVLVDALKRVGPVLSREALRRTLDEMLYESAITSPLDWGPGVPAERVGNKTARAVRLVEGKPSDAGTGWVADPTPGRFPS